MFFFKLLLDYYNTGIHKMGKNLCYYESDIISYKLCFKLYSFQEHSTENPMDILIVYKQSIVRNLNVWLFTYKPVKKY